MNPSNNTALNEQAWPSANLLVEGQPYRIGVADEHETQLAELYQRVGNDLQNVGSLAEVELRRCPYSVSSPALEQIVRRVMALAALYRHMRVESSNTINFVEYLDELHGKIVDTIHPDICDVRLVVDLKQVWLRAEMASCLAVTVNELVANAAKHAFPEGSPGIITIRLRQLAPGKAALSVSDNGRGFQGRRAGGRGLEMVQGLARAAGAELSRTNGCGTTWTLQFDMTQS